MQYSKIKTTIIANKKRTLSIFIALIAIIIIGLCIRAYRSKTIARNEIVSSQPTKTIYLTMDMDMNQKMYWLYRKNKVRTWYDPNVFAYLEKNNIPTTFFVSGLFAKTYSSLVKNLASHPNFSFQNHSYDESSFIPGCYWLQTLTTTQEKISQINTTENIIEETTGQTPTYFRFPGICHNAKNDILIRALGYTLNDATINVSDPFNYNVPAMVGTVISKAYAGGVIIMHIGGPNAPKSLAVLERIYPRLVAKGYMFEKL